MYSGVPNAGAPVFISTFEVNVPIAQGAPGLTTCKSAIAASPSASDSVTAPDKKPRRRPNTCHECGHRKMEGEYKALHRRARVAKGTSQRKVPVEERRDSVLRTGRKVGQEGLRRLDVCDCPKCKPVPPVPDVQVFCTCKLPGIYVYAAQMILLLLCTSCDVN